MLGSVRIATAILGLSFALCPIAFESGPARPAVSDRIPQIGFLSAGSPGSSAYLNAFRIGLAGLGYVEGATVSIHWRWAEGDPVRLDSLARDLARLPVDVIIAPSSAAARAAQRATHRIPIVVQASADPVGSALAATEERPGSNVTGLSMNSAGTLALRLAFLRQAAPLTSSVAVLWNPENRASGPQLLDLQQAAWTLGIRLSYVPIGGAHAPRAAFDAIAAVHPDALLLLNDERVSAMGASILAFASHARILAIYPWRDWVSAGGVMSLGPDPAELFRHSAIMVDKILKGANPATLPIETAQRLELVVNLRAAQRLPRPLSPGFLRHAILL